MSGSLAEVAFAAVLFVGSHVLLSGTPLRARLAQALGERPFLGLYSAVSGVLLVWLVWSHARAPFVPLWWAPSGAAWLPVLVMPLALLLLVGGYSQPNPTAVAQAKPGEGKAAGILAITRHPIMWAIALWALAHLVVNGDAASVILFGSLALLALIGTVLIDRKKRRSWGAADWRPFAAATSNLPFAALLSGRASLRFADIGWRRFALAAGLYLVLLALHPIVIGVSPLPA